MSHIVTIKASPEYHSLCGDRVEAPWHIVTMPDQDKNGGPNHLKAWRDYRKLTQAELAAEVGTNANMIGYLESGERGLSAKWLRRLAPALRITPGFLLDHDPNDLSEDLIETWTTADERQKKQISAMARVVVHEGGKTGTDDK